VAIGDGKNDLGRPKLRGLKRAIEGSGGGGALNIEKLREGIVLMTIE